MDSRELVMVYRTENRYRYNCEHKDHTFWAVSFGLFGKVKMQGCYSAGLGLLRGGVEAGRGSCILVPRPSRTGIPEITCYRILCSNTMYYIAYTT